MKKQNSLFGRRLMVSLKDIELHYRTKIIEEVPSAFIIFGLWCELSYKEHLSMIALILKASRLFPR